MKIHVGKNNYIINSDSRQYMLGKYTGRKDNDGRDIIDYIGFYTTVEPLLVYLVEKEARLSAANSLDKYIDDYRQIAEDVKKVAAAMASLINSDDEFKKLLDQAD